MRSKIKIQLTKEQYNFLYKVHALLCNYKDTSPNIHQRIEPIRKFVYNIMKLEYYRDEDRTALNSISQTYKTLSYLKDYSAKAEHSFIHRLIYQYEVYLTSVNFNKSKLIFKLSTWTSKYITVHTPK